MAILTQASAECRPGFHLVVRTGVDVMTVHSDVGTSVEENRVLLGGKHPGWRIGRGGSGRWWAVRGADHVWAATPEDLDAELTRHAS